MPPPNNRVCTEEAPQPSTPSPSDLCFALEGARTGPRAAPHTPAWVWVRNGIVEHVGSAPPPQLPLGTMHLQGGWAIEPLADAHVHLFLDGARDPAARARTAHLTHDEALERILGVLERYRSLGIAAVRDGGDPHGLALEAARTANDHPDRYATVLPAGAPVFRRGCYGRFLGRGIDRASEARKVFDENRLQGATHAKVLATGLNSLDVSGRVGPTQFDPGELGVIAKAAGDLDLPLMIHANGPLAGILAAGPDSVEHGFGCDGDDLRQLAERGVAWVPTLGAWAELLDHPGLTEAQRTVVGRTDRRHRQEVRAGHALGVPITAGSDAGTPGVVHGEGLHREIERLIQAGLSPEAALASATHRARQLCQKESVRPLGGLSPGQPAGFVWLVEDPVATPPTLSRPKGVFLGGVWSPTDGRTSGRSA